MFTGIVIEQGVVAEPPPRLRLRAPGVAADAAIGDSVAVDGCCLTVTEIDGVVLAFDAVPETLRRTNLGRLQPGDEVNLEPALRAGDRMGGHLVQGHVDAVGSLRDIAAEAEAVNMTFEAPENVLRYVIEKGSIAVNGVALTVTAFDDRELLGVGDSAHARGHQPGPPVPGRSDQPGSRPVWQVR